MKKKYKINYKNKLINIGGSSKSTDNLNNTFTDLNLKSNTEQKRKEQLAAQERERQVAQEREREQQLAAQERERQAALQRKQHAIIQLTIEPMYPNIRNQELEQQRKLAEEEKKWFNRR